ncbi:DUF6760 family protein [Propionibacteriaceae bacterium Y2011]|uniref:DUF6760 family protein n=1 Tax=Microlunatus sp. Y2014 TaxID=3418488 RepID=UPI003B4C1F21
MTLTAGLPTHYDIPSLWEEMSYLAYHLHWDLDRLLDLEHGDRHLLVDQVAGLNQRAWEELRDA